MGSVKNFNIDKLLNCKNLLVSTIFLSKKRWQGEDANCQDRTTVAQKTHRLHKNQACKFERGLVIVRNPFDAILAAYNHHKAGKTGEPDYKVFKEGKDWVNFVDQWIKRWTQFHQEWMDFEGTGFQFS